MTDSMSKYNFSGNIRNNTVVDTNHGTVIGSQENHITDNDEVDSIFTEFIAFVKALQAQAKYQNLVRQEEIAYVIETEVKSLEMSEPQNQKWKNFLKLPKLMKGTKKAFIEVGKHFTENNVWGKGAVAFLEGVTE